MLEDYLKTYLLINCHNHLVVVSVLFQNSLWMIMNKQLLAGNFKTYSIRSIILVKAENINSLHSPMFLSHLW